VETSAGQRRHSLFQRVGEEIVFVCINLNLDWFAISNHNFKRLAEFQRARKLRVRHRPCRKIINPAISSVHNDFFNRCAVYSAGNFDEPKIAHSIMASHLYAQRLILVLGECRCPECGYAKNGTHDTKQLVHLRQKPLPDLSVNIGQSVSAFDPNQRPTNLPWDPNKQRAETSCGSFLGRAKRFAEPWDFTHGKSFDFTPAATAPQALARAPRPAFRPKPQCPRWDFFL
jgi:hypothetical protein